MEIINVPALGLTAIKTDGPPQLGNESTELQELHDSPGVILASPNENKKRITRVSQIYIRKNASAAVEEYTKFYNIEV